LFLPFGKNKELVLRSEGGEKNEKRRGKGRDSLSAINQTKVSNPRDTKGGKKRDSLSHYYSFFPEKGGRGLSSLHPARGERGMGKGEGGL